MNWQFAISFVLAVFWTAPASSEPGEGNTHENGQLPPTRKTFHLAFRNAKHIQVWRWLVKETGMPVVSTVNHEGALTVIPTKRNLTLTEVLDHLNRALAKEDLYLIHRDQSFVVWTMKKQIPVGLGKSVSPDELDNHPDTEFVTMSMSLQGTDAEMAQITVKRLLGPLGKVTAMPSTNEVLFQDEVRTLRSIVTLLSPL